MGHREPLKTLLPTEAFELESGLSLISRVRLNLTIYRADKSVSQIDEWKLKRSLIEYLRKSHSISVPEEDIKVSKYKDAKKRKREDPVARGSLFLLDFDFLLKKLRMGGEEEVGREFLEWRKGLAAEMDGMELNLEGVKFKLSVEVPKGDDFDGMRKEWEEIAAFGSRGVRQSEHKLGHKDFCKTLKVLCGRSLTKEADYDVSWEKDGFFRNGSNVDPNRLKDGLQ